MASPFDDLLPPDEEDDAAFTYDPEGGAAAQDEPVLDLAPARPSLADRVQARGATVEDISAGADPTDAEIVQGAAQQAAQDFAAQTEPDQPDDTVDVADGEDVTVPLERPAALGGPKPQPEGETPEQRAIREGFARNADGDTTYAAWQVQLTDKNGKALSAPRVTNADGSPIPGYTQYGAVPQVSGQPRQSAVQNLRALNPELFGSVDPNNRNADPANAVRYDQLDFIQRLQGRGLAAAYTNAPDNRTRQALVDQFVRERVAEDVPGVGRGRAVTAQIRAYAAELKANVLGLNGVNVRGFTPEITRPELLGGSAEATAANIAAHPLWKNPDLRQAIEQGSAADRRRILDRFVANSFPRNAAARDEAKLASELLLANPQTWLAPGAPKTEPKAAPEGWIDWTRRKLRERVLTEQPNYTQDVVVDVASRVAQLPSDVVGAGATALAALTPAAAEAVRSNIDAYLDTLPEADRAKARTALEGTAARLDRQASRAAAVSAGAQWLSNKVKEIGDWALSSGYVKDRDDRDRRVAEQLKEGGLSGATGAIRETLNTPSQLPGLVLGSVAPSLAAGGLAARVAQRKGSAFLAGSSVAAGAQASTQRLNETAPLPGTPGYAEALAEFEASAYSKANRAAAEAGGYPYDVAQDMRDRAMTSASQSAAVAFASAYLGSKLLGGVEGRIASAVEGTLAKTTTQSTLRSIVSAGSKTAATEAVQEGIDGWLGATLEGYQDRVVGEYKTTGDLDKLMAAMTTGETQAKGLYSAFVGALAGAPVGVATAPTSTAKPAPAAPAPTPVAPSPTPSPTAPAPTGPAPAPAPTSPTPAPASPSPTPTPAAPTPASNGQVSPLQKLFADRQAQFEAARKVAIDALPAETRPAYDEDATALDAFLSAQPFGTDEAGVRAKLELERGLRDRLVAAYAEGRPLDKQLSRLQRRAATTTMTPQDTAWVSFLAGRVKVRADAEKQLEEANVRAAQEQARQLETQLASIQGIDETIGQIVGRPDFEATPKALTDEQVTDRYKLLTDRQRAALDEELRLLDADEASNATARKAFEATVAALAQGTMPAEGRWDRLPKATKAAFGNSPTAYKFARNVQLRLEATPAAPPAPAPTLRQRAQAAQAAQAPEASPANPQASAGTLADRVADRAARDARLNAALTEAEAIAQEYREALAADAARRRALARRTPMVPPAAPTSALDAELAGSRAEARAALATTPGRTLRDRTGPPSAGVFTPDPAMDRRVGDVDAVLAEARGALARRVEERAKQKGGGKSTKGKGPAKPKGNNLQSPLAATPISYTDAQAVVSNVAASAAAFDAAISAGNPNHVPLDWQTLYFADDADVAAQLPDLDNTTFSTYATRAPDANGRLTPNGDPLVIPTIYVNLARVADGAQLEDELRGKIIANWRLEAAVGGAQMRAVANVATSRAMQTREGRAIWEGIKRAYEANGRGAEVGEMAASFLNVLAARQTPLAETFLERMAAWVNGVWARFRTGVEPLTTADLAGMFHQLERARQSPALTTVLTIADSPDVQRTVNANEARYSNRMAMLQGTYNDLYFLDLAAREIAQANPNATGLVNRFRRLLDVRHGNINRATAEVVNVLDTQLQTALADAANRQGITVEQARGELDKVLLYLQLNEMLDPNSTYALQNHRLDAEGRQLATALNDMYQQQLAATPDDAGQRALALQYRLDLQQLVQLHGRPSPRLSYAGYTREQLHTQLIGTIQPQNYNAALAVIDRIRAETTRNMIRAGMLSAFEVTYHGYRHYVPKRGSDRGEEVSPEQIRTASRNMLTRAVEGRVTLPKNVGLTMLDDLRKSAVARSDLELRQTLGELVQAENPQNLAPGRVSRRQLLGTTDRHVPVTLGTASNPLVMDHSHLPTGNRKTLIYRDPGGQLRSVAMNHAQMVRVFDPTSYAVDGQPWHQSGYRLAFVGKLGQSSGFAARSARGLASVLGSLQTARNPIFWPKQLWRDFSVIAKFMLTRGYGARANGVFLQTLSDPQTWRSIARYAGLPPERRAAYVRSLPQGNIVREWIDLGGYHDIARQFSAEGTVAKAQSQQFRDRFGLTPGVQSGTRLLELVDAGASTLDNVVRVAYYAGARAAGRSQDEAVRLAVETMNWSQSSDIGRAASLVYPFAKARAIGQFNLLNRELWVDGVRPERQVLQPDGTYRVELAPDWARQLNWKFIAGAALVGFLGYMLARTVWGDDEKMRPNARELMGNAMVPGVIVGDRPLMLPLQLGADRFVTGLGQLVAAAFVGDIAPGDALREITNATLEEVTPVASPTIGDPTADSSALTTSLVRSVGIAQVPLALATNTNIFGGTIYRSDPYSRYTPQGNAKLSTPQVWVDAAKWARDHMPGGENLRPEAIPFVLQAFGFLGQAATALAKAGHREESALAELTGAKHFVSVGGKYRVFNDVKRMEREYIDPYRQRANEIKRDKTPGGLTALRGMYPEWMAVERYVQLTDRLRKQETEMNNAMRTGTRTRKEVEAQMEANNEMRRKALLEAVEARNAASR